MATAKITPGEPAVVEVVVPATPDTVTLTISREEAQAVMTLTAHVVEAYSELSAAAASVHHALDDAGVRYFRESHLVIINRYGGGLPMLAIKKGPRAGG